VVVGVGQRGDEPHGAASPCPDGVDGGVPVADVACRVDGVFHLPGRFADDVGL
jgi:hypothetical protein